MTEEKVQDNNSVSTISMKDELSNEPEGADFETAVSATGFGKFNLLLLLTAVPSIITVQFETTSLSFVFPVAQCDLKLTLEDKGLVNAVIYTGMISSCFIWGALADIFGRRKILIIAHFLDCVFVLMATFSPNFAVLLAAKFLGGFIINGTCMALTPYLSEFHGKNHRSRVPLTIGLLYSVGNICLPLLAWSILPLGIKYNLFEGFEFHAWNLFLLICALPAFISGIFFALMPETPKYLMTKGNNDEALDVFQKIYKLNTGLPKQSYPINTLINEKQIFQKKHARMKEAWKQISPLFSRKYAANLILLCFIQMLLLVCVNTLRLWLPEILQTINDYEYFNKKTAPFCKMLELMHPNVENVTKTCTVNFNNSSVYISSTIIAVATTFGYLTATYLINKLGKKKLLIGLGFTSGISVTSLYFAPNSSVVIVLICINTMCLCVCVDIVITIVIDLFPTHLRASALSLALMCGRIGSVLGNLIFPFLLQAGCAPPVFTLGCLAIGCAMLSLFLPKTDFKALE